MLSGGAALHLASVVFTPTNQQAGLHSTVAHPGSPQRRCVITTGCSCLVLLPVQARDLFYQCVKESGVLYSSKTPIPSKCKQLRAKFESACLQSWVCGCAFGCGVQHTAGCALGLSTKVVFHPSP